ERLVRRLLRQQGEQQRVVLVLQYHVLLGLEVPEERAGRDLRRGGDLVDRGLLVPLLLEQPQRMLLDGPAGLLLLAFTQAGRAHVPILPRRPAPAHGTAAWPAGTPPPRARRAAPPPRRPAAPGPSRAGTRAARRRAP